MIRRKEISPMSFFRDLSIQGKLLGGFLLVLAISGAATGFVLFRTGATNDRFTDQVGPNNKAALHAAELRTIFQAQHQELKNIFLRGHDEAALEKHTVAFTAAGEELKAKRDELAADIATVESKTAADLLERFDAGYETYMSSFPAALAAAKGDGTSFDPIAGDKGMSGKDRDAQAALAEMAEKLSNRADIKSDNTIESANLTAKVGLAVVVAASIAGVAIGFLIARAIKAPIVAVVERLTSLQAHDVTSLQAGLSAFSSGDLTMEVQPVTKPIDNPAKDEVGRAGHTVNLVIGQMVETIGSYNTSRTSLATLIGEVQLKAESITSAADSLRDSSDQMASATGQIAVAINEVTRSAVNLSSLSQDSAREIEQVAAGSQQLAATAGSSADSASQSKLDAADIGTRIQLVATASKEVAAAAEESRMAAQEGQEAVVQAVTSMESIATAVQRASRTVDQLGEYGQQIGDIVKAIDEIAAQTNLLALNAAIEAARAGEQGRGFAVVAENVRSLAERSSGSTKEIADLIAKVQAGTQEAVEAMAAGVSDVEAGRTITTRAGEALESIITSVQQSAVRMQQIAGDVQGLASGAERIVHSAEQIASMAGESASGASEMARGTTRVTEAIVQVSATSEETSASAEEVSASTEELSAQSEELAATANQMKDLAQGLQVATARFRLA